MNKNILPSGRKATRYEYELKIVNFLNNNKKNLGEHCLEISGDTHIFTNYFRKKNNSLFSGSRCS